MDPRASAVGAVRMPSAPATWLPGSDSTAKVRPFFSAIDSDPSGFCGLTAISAIPRASSSGTRFAWYFRSAMLQYGHHVPR